MARVALLDVNVLVALFDADHVHHDLAHDWFAKHRAGGWATCPLTENGFLRIASSPRYRPDAERPDVLADHLRRFCSSGHHHFWPATISLRDQDLFVVNAGWSHRQIADLYLLGLAKKMGGALATFDRTIPLTAVKSLKRDQLAVIAPLAG
jgi:hypothetical protein